VLVLYTHTNEYNSDRKQQIKSISTIVVVRLNKKISLVHVIDHDRDVCVVGHAGIWLGHKSKHIARQFQFVPNKK
jgi:hypothetical protein